MSYVNMDHADWVTRSNAAARKTTKKQKRDKRGTVIGRHQAPEPLTDFQAKVMNILGIVGNGIYNAPICWDTVDWNCGDGISLTWRHSISTFDFDKLTRLVFLCHDARIRLNIDAAARDYFRLSFWQRSHEGGMARRHPNLEEAVTAHRAYVSADHSIMYNAGLETAA